MIYICNKYKKFVINYIHDVKFSLKTFIKKNFLKKKFFKCLFIFYVLLNVLYIKYLFYYALLIFIKNQ